MEENDKKIVAAVDTSSHHDIARWGINIAQTDELDDWSSEWEICKRTGGVWGGRKVRISGFSSIVIVALYYMSMHFN